MNTITFQWHDRKNIINQKKHQISFEEATMVFYDENAIIFDDPEHSIGEERFLIIGRAKFEKMFIVSYCYRGRDRYDNDVIRIISARKATNNEIKVYYEYI